MNCRKISNLQREDKATSCWPASSRGRWSLMFTLHIKQSQKHNRSVIYFITICSNLKLWFWSVIWGQGTAHKPPFSSRAVIISRTGGSDVCRADINHLIRPRLHAADEWRTGSVDVGLHARRLLSEKTKRKHRKCTVTADKSCVNTGNHPLSIRMRERKSLLTHKQQLEQLYTNK